MGAKCMHERFAHYLTTAHARETVEKLVKRNKYTLRFKAKVLKAFDNLRGIRCTACTGLLVPGSYVEDGADNVVHTSEYSQGADNMVGTSEYIQWNLDEGCECGGKTYMREVKCDMDVAAKFGIHKSLLSKWRQRRDEFLEFIKRKPEKMKLVNKLHFVYVYRARAVASRGFIPFVWEYLRMCVLFVCDSILVLRGSITMSRRTFTHCSSTVGRSRALWRIRIGCNTNF
jgi:hypothetical protein